MTRLSPYITRGVISLPEIADIILQKYSLAQGKKFIQELSWREYFNKVYLSRRDEIFSDLKNAQPNVRHLGVPQVLFSGETFIATLDGGIQDLIEKGYIHNHMRMWLAGFVTGFAKFHWYEPSRWMYYHLYDGDVASNTLSWQWVAGSFSSKQYTFSQSLMDACGGVSENNYLDIDRDDFCHQDVPTFVQQSAQEKLSWSKPASDCLIIDSGQPVLLYHPWNLNPKWRNDVVSAQKILVLEPSHFERFPVSEKVTEYIINLARIMIPDIQVFVGEVSEIQNLDCTQEIFSQYSIHTEHFPGNHDLVPELFPEIQGYHSSFFKFWKKCEKHLSTLTERVH